MCCVCAAWYGSPLCARICIGDCAHRSPPDWAHTRQHLHRDQVHPPPTSATGLSRSLAHLCTAKESIPRPHLHRSRVHPSPTSAPPLLPSGTSASAQHRCDAAAQRNVLQPHALCRNRVPPGNDAAADGTCCNRLHAAALPCDWLHPIQSKQAKTPLAESRGVCAALWTSIGFDVSEAVPLTAPSIPAATGREDSMCGLFDLARSSCGPSRLSASASASASGLGGAHEPNMGPLPSVGCRGEMGHRGPSREAERPLLLRRAARAARAAGAGARPLCRGPAGLGGGFACWAWRPGMR